MTKYIKKLPFHANRTCYACDDGASGLRDRKPEGGSLEYACDRHKDPKIKTFIACMYCSQPVRKGALYLDGDYAHASCAKFDSN